MRKCPVCGKKLSYLRKGDMLYRERKSSSCGSCAKTGKNHPNYGKHRSIETIEKISVSKTGKSRPPFSEKWIENLRKSHLGEKNHRFGKHGMFYDCYDDWMRYKLDVRRITKKQPLFLLENFNKRGRAGIENAYQLDHIISVCDGFKRGITPEKIGNITNLRMIPWKENLIKGIMSLENTDGNNRRE